MRAVILVLRMGILMFYDFFLGKILLPQPLHIQVMHVSPKTRYEPMQRYAGQRNMLRFFSGMLCSFGHNSP